MSAVAHCQTFIIRIFFSHLDEDVSPVCELCGEEDGGDKRLCDMHTHVRNIFLHS